MKFTPLSLLSIVALAALWAPSMAQGSQLAPAADEPPSENNPPDDDSGQPKQPPKSKPKEAADQCVKHSTESRFVSGYDHLVHVENQCEASATCSVSTNVNPKAQVITVAGHGHTTVLTYRGSPARDFVATVDCKMNN